MIQAEQKKVPPQEAFEALKALKEQGYNMLVDFTAVDYSAWGKDPAHPIAAARGEEYGTPHLPGLPTFDPVDLPKRPTRFEVVYRLMKLNPKTGMDEGRLELRCDVPEGEPVLRSAKSLWPIADWLEREVWDMFGIRFVDRPDIKRLMMYESFVGHPMRKDYPITKRQPQIGPPSGERPDNPSFNTVRPTIKYE